MEAARTRTSTLSSSITGLSTSLSSRTSGDPYLSWTIAFIVISGEPARWHPSQSLPLNFVRCKTPVRRLSYGVRLSIGSEVSSEPRHKEGASGFAGCEEKASCPLEHGPSVARRHRDRRQTGDRVAH